MQDAISNNPDLYLFNSITWCRYYGTEAEIQQLMKHEEDSACEFSVSPPPQSQSAAGWRQKGHPVRRAPKSVRYLYWYIRQLSCSDLDCSRSRSRLPAISIINRLLAISIINRLPMISFSTTFDLDHQPTACDLDHQPTACDLDHPTAYMISFSTTFDLERLAGICGPWTPSAHGPHFLALMDHSVSNCLDEIRNDTN